MKYNFYNISNWSKGKYLKVTLTLYLIPKKSLKMKNTKNVTKYCKNT